MDATWCLKRWRRRTNCRSALATYRIASPPPPTITGQPTDQTVNNGATATFSVTTGTAPITYQWQDNSSGSFADISGATSSSYSPTASYSIQGRQYRCIVTDANGTATSAAATLRVAFSLSGTGFAKCFAAGASVQGRGVRGVGAWHGVGWRRCWWRWMRQSPVRRPSHLALTTQIRLSGSASIQSTVAAALTTTHPAVGCGRRVTASRCAEHVDPAVRDAYWQVTVLFR